MNKKEVMGNLFWAMSSKEVLEELETSDAGLTNEEAEKRVKQYGLNEIAREKGRSILKIFFIQFKNAFVLILIFAAILSYFLGEKINATIILSMVLLSSFLSFFMEYKSENTLRKLRRYIRLKSRVFRNGQIQEIDSNKLVPGDIIHLDIGDVIPADIRLISSNNLTTDESVLTGESMFVEKKTSQINEKYTSPQQLVNMVFMGTSVSNGSGLGVVVSTGENTFFGKTAAYLKEKTPEEPFQKGIRNFTNLLLKVVVVMVLFIFILNAILHNNFLDSLLFALAIAIGITPEILPVVMTVALSYGALKMAREKVIVKKLSSVEDLGNIDTLCVDKTGTLTEGKVSLISHMDLSGKEDDKMLLYGLLCNSGIGKTIHLADNPLDKAIWDHRKTPGLLNHLKTYNILEENEFDYERRRMSVLASMEGQNIFIAKGAPESILTICTHMTLNGKKVEITKALRSKIEERVSGYEKKGYRVILLAEKHTLKQKLGMEGEKNLSLSAILLFLDPPKATAKEALEKLEKLGVNVKILTGDSPIITKKICEEVNFNIAGRVITGEELSKLNKLEFESYCLKYNVFARITPEQKFAIVKCLNNAGHVVGFLGDGVNDAPALRLADVGISVNTASDIAKDAADIILLHKSLNVLANGLMDGRKTFGNITKYILSALSSNYGNMFTFAGASLFLRFLPLLPSQILLNNFLSDVSDLSVASDNVDEQFLKKPKKWNMSFIFKFMIYFGLITSLADFFLIIPLILIFHTDVALFRTSWFVESVLEQAIVLFAIRTALPFYKSKPSMGLTISALVMIAITLILPFTAFGAKFFKLVPIPGNILVLIFVVIIGYFATIEFAKRIFYKKYEQ